MRPISPAWVSACLARARRSGLRSIVNEYTLLPEHCPSIRPGELFRVEPGGGARLGRRRGARRQARRARPAGHRRARRRLVPVRATRSRCITPRRCTGCRCCSSSSTMRCGARCAAPPWACTRRARRRAATARRLSTSTSLPAFEQVCAAAGGYGERVEDPAELPAALERALHAVNVEKRQALLNVICQGGGGG